MKEQENRLILIERQDLRGALIVITGFTAVLCWWIGISGYMNVGGLISGGSGFFTFLLVPILATAVTIESDVAISGLRASGGTVPTSELD